MRVLEFLIGPQEAGWTVERYLRNRQGFPRKRIIKLKHDPQGMLRNGLPVRSIDLLDCGDALRIQFQEDALTPVEAGEGITAPVAYEDRDTLVFLKPAGMPVHPSTNHYNDTLANVFASYCRDHGERLAFRPINRLDRDTTGLVVVAKNPLSAAKLWRQVGKEYFALVQGFLPEEDGCIDLPIGRENDSIIRREVRPDGKPARTRFRVLARGRQYTALGILLDTGRTHQIRVHFSHLGFPLVGDTLYGVPHPDLSHQALHCRKVWFPQMETGQLAVVTAPFPQDLLQLIKQDGMSPQMSWFSDEDWLCGDGEGNFRQTP